MDSQYRSTANTNLVLDALARLHIELPIKATLLASKTASLEEDFQSPQILRKIHSLNKRLILQQLQQLCESIGSVYAHQKVSKGKNIGKTIGKINQQVFRSYPYNGNFYIQRLQQNLHSLELLENDINILTCILQTVALAHYDNFELGKVQISAMTMTRNSQHSRRIPEKYEAVIQAITLKYVGRQSHQDDNEASGNAMRMTNALVKNLLAGAQIEPENEEKGSSPEGTTAETKPKKENKLKRIAQQLFCMASEKINKDKKKTEQGQIKTEKKRIQEEQASENNHNNQYQDKINMLMAAIANKQISEPPHKTTKNLTKNSGNSTNVTQNQIPVTIEDLFGLEGASNLSYYETHMISHLANLVLCNKLDVSLIQYYPYLQILKKSIEREIVKIKQEGNNFKDTSARSAREAQKIKNPDKNPQNDVSPGFCGYLQKAKNAVNKKIKDATGQKDEPPIPEQVTNKYSFDYYFGSLVRDLEQECQQFTKLPQYHERQSNFIPKALTDIISHVENKIKVNFDEHCYYEIQSWILVIILLYKQLAMKDPRDVEKYNPLRRRTIIKILKVIYNPTDKGSVFTSYPTPSFQNWPAVLKYLQNHRPEIMEIKGPSITEQSEQILSYLITNIGNPEKVGASLSSIFHGGLEKFKEEVPKMKLVCLSNGSKGKGPQCKVVNILISGFLSEDTDKMSEWADMVDMMPDSEIYALCWESNTIKNLVLFILKSTKDLLFAINKVTDELKRKFQDNPFNPAFAVAQITGRILAELIIRLFPNRFVNVFGYSLGSEVIKQFMFRMVETNRASILNNVYMMGGVSDIRELTNIVRASTAPLSIYNCYTLHDSVLKRLLSLCKPEITPIGLHDMPRIPGHSVNNVNCTKFISGHLAFRSNLDVMGEVLEMSTG